MNYYAIDGNGKLINPLTAIVPIIKEKSIGHLQTIGTGFYISRYGLLLTAKHVIEEIKIRNINELANSFVGHISGNDGLILRKIISASYLKAVDIGIIQADNYIDKYPNNPLMNSRVLLSTKIPTENKEIVTYAFPENSLMDFNNDNNLRCIKSDFYKGKFLKYVIDSQNPSIPFPHFETTIKLRSGTSGGPVFCDGKVIGVNCMGWDFGENIPEDENLSYIVPINEVFPLKIHLKQLPDISWEKIQLNEYQNNKDFTIKDLIDLGHIDLEKNHN